MGGVAHRTDILERGVTAHELGRARHSGELLRVRRAWYAVPGAPSAIVRAVRVGGALTGPSAAHHRGLWTVDDGRLHVSVARNASRLRSDRTRFLDLSSDAESTVCVHWRKSPGADRRIVSTPVEIFLHALECQNDEQAIAIADSALNRGLVTLDELREATRDLPRRYARAAARADPRSESGTETFVRLRLAAHGIHVTPQARCGSGRVDVLVGERLVIECHSRAHHTGIENYARDREREMALIDENYLTMTLSYEQVMFDWDRAESIIRGIVARRDHLWPGARGRAQFRKYSLPRL